jgi:radical SAM superfamily enzyme YgiQ (UPF0313 family)
LTAQRKFHVELIKPSHYDEDGYVIQWWKAWIPSNSLACLYGLTQDLAQRKALGEDVEIVINAYDEINTVVPVSEIVQRVQAGGGHGLICLVGVQSNQFPRAVDLARQFLAAGLQVAVGGFHVSGCLSMLKDLPADLQEALDQGISFFAGEAEGRLDGIFGDALEGRLKPIYNFLDDLPGLEDQVTPFLPEAMVRRYDGMISSFDAGRGCPFQCSFCTIINVQGRKSRYRSDDDIERLIRANTAQGIHRFFITDDNFARNRNWEAIFDRLIELREEGLDLRFLIQVDTLCHQIPKFIEKAKRAGCTHAFIGLESINPDNLAAAKKKQNRITEYRKMFQDWRDHGIVTYAGFIMGFPVDTPETIARDIEIIQNELPVDLLEFTILTPLPGSEDHKNLAERGIWMDPDMNIYDLEHVTTRHPLMGPEELLETYRTAWDLYFTEAHVERLMRRAIASGIKPVKIWQNVMQIHGSMHFEGVHPQQGGYFRRKVRTQRRHGVKLESPLVFYPRRLWELFATYGPFLAYGWTLHRLRKRIERDPTAKTYRDLALTPVAVAEDEELEMFHLNDSAEAAVAKAKGEAVARAKHTSVAAE